MWPHGGGEPALTVLSTTSCAPRACATWASSSSGATTSVGLLTVSVYTTCAHVHALARAARQLGAIGSRKPRATGGGASVAPKRVGGKQAGRGTGEARLQCGAGPRQERQQRARARTHLGVGAHGRRHGRHVAHVDKGDLDAALCGQKGLEQRVRAAVDRVGGHDVVAVVAQRQQRRGDGRHACVEVIWGKGRRGASSTRAVCVVRFGGGAFRKALGREATRGRQVSRRLLLTGRAGVGGLGVLEQGQLLGQRAHGGVERAPVQVAACRRRGGWAGGAEKMSEGGGRELFRLCRSAHRTAGGRSGVSTHAPPCSGPFSPWKMAGMVSAVSTVKVVLVSIEGLTPPCSPNSRLAAVMRSRGSLDVKAISSRAAAACCPFAKATGRSGTGASVCGAVGRSALPVHRRSHRVDVASGGRPARSQPFARRRTGRAHCSAAAECSQARRSPVAGSLGAGPRAGFASPSLLRRPFPPQQRPCRAVQWQNESCWGMETRSPPLPLAPPALLFFAGRKKRWGGRTLARASGAPASRTQRRARCPAQALPYLQLGLRCARGRGVWTRCHEE